LSQIPSVLVDSGYFLADDRNAHGDLRPDTVVKDDWAAKAYDQFPVDVVNLSSRELKYFSRFLTKAEFDARAASQPLLRRLVSANTQSALPDIVAPQPFIILEIPARQKNSLATRLRIAFIGLTDTERAPPRGFKFVDPIEAVNRVLPEAHKRADLVILLAFLKPEEASRVAREAEGIDAIIATNSGSDGSAFTPPITSGKTSIVFTPLETRLLGELRFYRDSQGKYSSACRFISLDEVIPDDPAAKQVVTDASSAEAGARSASKQFLEEWLASSRMLIRNHPASRGLSGSAGGYITSSACSKCHGAQYLKWASSAHSHATDPLPPRPFEFEATCLNCHATGWRVRTAGSTELPGLQAVQCEQCHGPGAEHAAKPAKGYGRIPDMKTACSTCHTPTTSPGFDLQAAWAKIKH
jgi:hypothetical protein